MFKDLKIRRKSYLQTGQSEDVDQDDTNMYRCNVCGVVNDARITEIAGERENADEELTGVVLVEDADGDLQPTQPRGCWNCGSLYSR